jgi:non-ribosomal peptide synthetase component F
MHLSDGSAEGRIGGFSETATDGIASAQDLDKIWSLNASVPESIPGCVHDLIKEIAGSQPDDLAVCAWNGDFTYRAFDALTDQFARDLIGLGIRPNSSIPLLFEKSRWTCVAMLGVIKAGCSAIALDTTQPQERLRSIVQQVQPSFIVSSATNFARAQSLTDVPIIQLNDSFLDRQCHSGENDAHLPIISPSTIVYISFTSGTSTYTSNPIFRRYYVFPSHTYKQLLTLSHSWSTQRRLY